MSESPQRYHPERFVAGGECLARHVDGRVMFVRGAVPGDEVSVAPVDERSDWSRSEVTEIHHGGPHRTTPPCQRHLEGCGGCDWQHVVVDAQIGAKRDIVRDALRRTARMPDARLVVGSTVSSEQYRTTVRVVGDADGRPSYRAARSHDTVPAAGCLVAHPGLQQVLTDTRLSPGLEMTLRVSAATGAVTARWDTKKGEVSGLGEHVFAGSRAFLEEDVAGHRFRVSAGSFFQSGPEAAELLVAAVQRHAPELDGADTVLDTYAGVGLFAAAATNPSSSLITVETSRSAVNDCHVNLEGRNAEIVREQFGRWRPAAGTVIDVAIADPARSGLGKPGVGALKASGAPVVVLVSCDPVSLARDAGLLAKAGYDHVVTEVLDLFPHTHHVECVTRFVKRGRTA